MVLVTLAASRHLLPYGGDAGGKLLALPKGIVTFVGIIACIAFLVEGAIMDWGGVFLTTVRHFDMALAGTGFTVFSAAMLTMRLLGDWTVQKLGQERVVIGGSLLAVAGFLLVILAADPVLLYLGFFAIVVPVFFSLLGKQHVSPSASLCRPSARSATSASSWAPPSSASSLIRPASTPPSACSPSSCCCSLSSPPMFIAIS